MTTTATQIADAVTTALKAATLSLTPVTIERRVKPDYDMKEMNGIRVTVVPAGIPSVARESRGHIREDFTINIGVQKQLQKHEMEPGSVFDNLIVYTREIRDYLRDRELTGYDNVRFISEENDPLYSLDAIQQNIFMSVITLTYASMREA